MKKRTTINTDLDTFAQVQEGTTMNSKLCSACQRPIQPKYDKCYACNTYGDKSFALVRQAKATVALKSDIMYSSAHNCILCNNALPEDSTAMHICPESAPMPKFRQVRSTQRKSRRASKVRTLTQEEIGIDKFDSRPRVFAGF